MKNLSKNRVRVPIVNKTKAAVFGFHLPFTASRVKDIKIGRSWWKARWTTTSRWAKIAKKMRMDDEGIFGITKLKLQAFSLAALEMSLGDIVVKVTSMMERSSIQITT